MSAPSQVSLKMNQMIYAPSAMRKTRSLQTLAEFFLLNIFLSSCRCLNSIDIKPIRGYRQTLLSSRPRPSESDFRTFTENYSMGRINIERYSKETPAVGNSPETVTRAPDSGKEEPVELDFSRLFDYAKSEQPPKNPKKQIIKNKIRKGLIPRGLEAVKRFYNWIVQSFKGLQKKRKTRNVPKKKTPSEGSTNDLDDLMVEFDQELAKDNKAQKRAAGGGPDIKESKDSSTAADEAEGTEVPKVKDRDVSARKFPSAKALREHYERKITQAVSSKLKNSDAIFKFMDVGFELVRHDFPLEKAAEIAAPGRFNSFKTQKTIKKNIKEIIDETLGRLQMDGSQFREKFQGYKDWYEIMYDEAHHPGFLKEIYWPLVQSAHRLVKTANKLRWGVNDPKKILGNVQRMTEDLRNNRQPKVIY